MTSQARKEQWKQIEQQQKQEGQQHQQKGGEQKKDKRPNFLTYNARIAWRFYSKLAQEAILALMLILPFYLYLKWTGVNEIVIPATLPVLWGIALVMFILQSFMFGKGG